MTIEFDTSDYRFSTGREPRGRGGWAFSVHHPRSRTFDMLRHAMFVPGSMTYAAARREVRRVARMFGYSGTVWVLS